MVEEQQQQKIDLLTLKSNFTGFSSSPSQSEHNLYLQVLSLIPFEEVSRKLRSQTQNLKPPKSGKRRPRTLRPKNTDPPKSGCGRQNGSPQGITIHHINDVINRNVNSQTTMSPLFLRRVLLFCYLSKVYIATKSLNNLNPVYTISARVNLRIFSQNTRLATSNQ